MAASRHKSAIHNAQNSAIRITGSGQKGLVDIGEFRALLVALYIAMPASKISIVAKQLVPKIEDNVLRFLMDVRASACDLCLP